MSALVKRSQSRLRRIGFPILVDGKAGPQTRQAIKDFQRGWAGRIRIRPHGRLSPYTRRAILWSARNGGKVGSRTPHLTWRECKSKGNGWPKVVREFAFAHEKLRRAYGGPVAYLSVYRDPAHNKEVGGARYSQHLYGTAGDLAQLRLSTRQVRSLGVYSGIGFNGGSGLVRHVDVRHAGPNNTTGGTPGHPTVWEYSA